MQLRPWLMASALLLGGACMQVANAAGWDCGPKRCFWKESYNGPVPAFAAKWGKPDSSTCYYVHRKLSGKWRMVCPEVDIRAR